MATKTGRSVTTQVYRVYIKATPEAIWDAITQPEWNQRWNAMRTEFDLVPGGAMRTRPSDRMRAVGAEKGIPVPEVAMDGEVIEANRPKRLVYTWRLLMGEGMAEEGFTRITWEIDEIEPDVSRVTVAHDLEGAPKVAAMVTGEREDEGGGGGWPEVLSGLKTLLETGEPLRDYKREEERT
jgi:uncharacterized protein YndB with AHSA1/START domain